MFPGDIHTIQELIKYCREILSLRPEGMSKKEQEIPAGSLVSLYVNDKCDEWEKEYSQLAEILNIASDLEWSNSWDTRADWQTIRRLVDELDEQARS